MQKYDVSCYGIDGLIFIRLWFCTISRRTELLGNELIGENSVLPTCTLGIEPGVSRLPLDHAAILCRLCWFTAMKRPGLLWLKHTINLKISRLNFDFISRWWSFISLVNTEKHILQTYLCRKQIVFIPKSKFYDERYNFQWHRTLYM